MQKFKKKPKNPPLFTYYKFYTKHTYKIVQDAK
jgi:hypothetical protein